MTRASAYPRPAGLARLVALAAALVPAQPAHAASPGAPAIGVPTGLVPAQAQDDPVRAALDICTNLPGNIEAARDALAASGWQSAEDAAERVLFSVSAAFRFDASDLAFTFQNAGFMAASILGNSALGPDQIGVEAGPYRLAVLGLPEGRPYCAMTGPDDLLQAIVGSNEVGQMLRQSSAVLDQAVGTYGDGFLIALARFDLAELDALLDASAPSAGDAAGYRDLVAPAILYIVTSESLQ